MTARPGEDLIKHYGLNEEQRCEDCPIGQAQWAMALVPNQVSQRQPLTGKSPLSVQCVHLIPAKGFSYVVPPTSSTGNGVTASPPVSSDWMTQKLGLSRRLPFQKPNIANPFPAHKKIPVRPLCMVTNGPRTGGQLCPQPKIAATRLVQAGSLVFPVVETSLEAYFIFLC